MNGLFATLKHTEQEVFMFKQAILPRIQSGNRYVIIGTQRLYVHAPFVVGNQDSKHETEAVWAVRY